MQSLASFAVSSEIRARYEVENQKNIISNYGYPSPSKQKLCFSCAAGTYGIHINSKFELQPCLSFNGKKDGYNIRMLGMHESLMRLEMYLYSVREKPIIGCFGCDSSVNCKMCPAFGEEVRYNEEVIGYKTNSEYCENIRNNYYNVMKKLNKNE
jgi:hypothetical protein